MSATLAADTHCRVTVIAAALRVDLAVPVRVAVAELLSIVVSSLGHEAADRGVGEGGWVLQRAAEDALDPARTLAACQVRDGDVLYLRTRAERLPALVFDDVLDAVATGVATRTSRWQPVHTRQMLGGFATASLSFALLALLLIGPPWTWTPVVAGVVAVLLEVVALAIARSHTQRAPACVAAYVAAGFAVPFGVVGAATAIGGNQQFWLFGAAQALAASGAGAVLAGVSLLVVGGGFGAFGAVATASVLTAVATGVAASSTLSGAGTAAVVAAAALAISPALPTLALRLSRLPLPGEAGGPGEHAPDFARIDSPQVLRQAARADQVLTGLVGGVGLAIAGATVLLSDRGPSESALALVLALICLLRARLFTGTGQRAALLLAGGTAIGSVVAGALAAMSDADDTSRILGFAVPAVLVAVVLLALTLTLPGRRFAPPLSRAADVVESLLVLSVIPLALAVVGVYGAVRNLHPG